MQSSMKRARNDKSVMEMLAAISEMVRVRILRVLDRQELTVGEVANVVQLPQSTVSRHLKVLAEGAWLTRRAAGTATLYQLVMDELSPAARAVWVTVRTEIGETSEIKEDNRRLRDVLSARKLDSQAFFGRVAGEWDEVRARLFGSDFTARALLSLLPRDWTVADLGCGTGNISELLAPRCEKVCAVDLSEPMLAAARKRLKGVANVQFLAGALEKLPLETGSVDAAICALVLHHVKEPLAALREMRRILRTTRSGGMLLVIDMLEHGREEFRQQMGHAHLGFSPDTIQRLMHEAGFGSTRVDTLPIDPSARGPGLFVAIGRLKS